MAKTLRCIFVLGGLLSILPLPNANAQREPRDIEEPQAKPEGRAALSVSVNQIRVDVTVHNNDGGLITGLTADNFIIYEDKIRQEITHFSPVEEPITVIVVVEWSRAPHIISAMDCRYQMCEWSILMDALSASYVAVDQMRPQDWMAVVAYDIRPEILVDFTQDKNAVLQSLRKLNEPTFMESNLFDTVWDVLDRIEELDNKVAIILLTTGIDTFSKKNLDATLDKVRGSNAVIYPVSMGGNFRARRDQGFDRGMDMGPFGSGQNAMDWFQADAILKAFAKYTGGTAYFPRFQSQNAGIYHQIALELRNRYALGYVSSSTKKDDKLRKIKVEVVADVDGDGKPDKKLKVRHREGYLTKKVD